MGKISRLKKTAKTDLATYLGVIAAFVIISALKGQGALSRSFTGQLVPICCYIVMAVSLNLTVGILGELSLGTTRKAQLIAIGSLKAWRQLVK